MTFDQPPDHPTRTVGGDQLRAALQDQALTRRRGLVVLAIGVVLIVVALVFAVSPAHSSGSTGLTTNQKTELPTPTSSPAAATGSQTAPPAAAPAAAATSGGSAPAAASSFGPSRPSGAATASTPPATAPPTTTTTRPQPTTTVRPSKSPTTTAVTKLPACVDSQFAPTVATNQSSYPSGQNVDITVTVVNTGPTCSGPDPVPCAVSASAAQSGSQVWNSSADAAPTNPTSCPPTTSTTIGRGWTSALELPWGQGYCAYNSSGRDCPEAQVSDGTYSIVGAVNNVDSPAVTITITG